MSIKILKVHSELKACLYAKIECKNQAVNACITHQQLFNVAHVDPKAYFCALLFSGNLKEILKPLGRNSFSCEGQWLFYKL